MNETEKKDLRIQKLQEENSNLQAINEEQERLYARS